MPKLRRQTFDMAIIKRDHRRESAIEASLFEMHLAGVSVRCVENITEALWDTRVSPGTVSKHNQKVYKHIGVWRNRPIEGEHPYVFLDGVVLERSWAGEVRNASVLVASASALMMSERSWVLPKAIKRTSVVGAAFCAT